MDTTPIRVQSLLRSFTTLTDAESDGSISLEFEDGGIASLSFSMNSHIARHSTLLIGTEGTLLIDDGKLRVNDEQITLDRSEDAFVRQMQEFVDAIRTDRTSIASGREVLPTMAVLDAAAKQSTITITS